MPITDAVFLLAERRAQPMHVGALLLFRPPAGAGPDWVPELYARMLGETDVAPLFRRRPEWSPRTLGTLAWVQDGDVDLEHHVRHSALPRPGRIRELLALTSRLHGTLLDRHRPLWELHLIEGLDDGRFAIYAKVHHSLLDGVAALRLFGTMLATDPEADVPAFWATRAAEPSPRSEAGVDLARMVDQAVAGVRDLAEVAPRLGQRALQVLRSQLGGQGAPPRTMLNVPITGARRYAAQSWPLARVRDVAKRAEATVNDVVLAMCGSALRGYLQSMDALPEASLIALSPVSLRDADDRREAGNAVGAILAPLGTDQADPVARLAVVKEAMTRGKGDLRGLDPFQATAMSGLTMAPLALNALGAVNRFALPPFNLVVSNVVGPRQTLYYNGAELDGMYPLSVLLDGQALNVTVTSYRGSLDFGLTGDRRALPHLQRLLGLLDQGLDELDRAVG